MPPHTYSRRSLLKATAGLSLTALPGGLISRTTAASPQWPSWRGAERNGKCNQAEWPEDFGDLSKAWSIDLGDSYSGPVVAGGKVFTTETVDRREETLTALDLENGRVLWKQRWPGAMSVPFFAKSNGDWIRSTPATDGSCIVVCGMRDVLASFQCETGQENWRLDCGSRFGVPLPAFGLVCSPLIDGDDLYVQAGGGIRKLRLSDGEPQWLAAADSGGMSGGSFSSPIIATLHGKRQLVAQTREALVGVDLQTGQPLWKHEVASFRGMNILTPTVWNDCVFTSSYGGKSQLIGFQPQNGQWKPELVWQGKAEAYMSSPVVVGNHLYLHLRNQRTCCINLATGEETWRTTPFGKYWSMVTNGSQILALDESGELLLLECDPREFRVMDRQQVANEACWAHVAIVGRRILIRRQRGLDAFTWS